MKKMIFIIFGLILMLSASCQIRPYIGGATADSLRMGGVWADSISTDGTFGGNSDQSLPTEKAVKTYVGTKLTSTDTTSFLTLTDTTYNRVLTPHDTNTLDVRINLKLNTSDSSKFLTTTDTLYNRVPSQTDLDKKLNISDTTAFLTTTDTTYGRVMTQNDIDNCDATDSLHHHANEGVLDDITAAYTTADDTRLAAINDTIAVIINATTDTLTSSEVKSGNIFPIGLALNGFNIYRVEAYSPSEGNGTQSIKVYRTRGGAETTVTSTGATIGGTATIDGTYDDMLTGDYLNVGFVETGASTYTISVDVIITFLRP